MKLMSVRIVVPCDDGVSLDELKASIVGNLQGLPVQRVGDQAVGPGAVPMRVHWSAVEARRNTEVRETGRTPKARKKAAAGGLL